MHTVGAPRHRVHVDGDATWVRYQRQAIPCLGADSAGSAGLLAPLPAVLGGCLVSFPWVSTEAECARLRSSTGWMTSKRC